MKSTDIQKAYDYVLTFGLETRHMWSKQRWSLIRVLFFVNRYMPFVDIPMALCSKCHHVCPTHLQLVWFSVHSSVGALNERPRLHAGVSISWL